MGLLNSYDELVQLSPQGSVFANRWWLEAVAPGRHKVLMTRDAGGRLSAAWPLVYRETDFGLNYEMPALTQKLGIMFAPSVRRPVETQSECQKLAADLIQQVGHVVEFRQNFHETFTDWLPFYWNGFTQTTRYTYVIEDVGELERVWSDLRPNHRRDIRRSQRLGLQVTDDLSLTEFLELNRKTFLRQGLNPLADDETIRRLDAACLANAGRKIFAAVDRNGRTHAAVYVVWWRDTAYYLMGGSEPELRDCGGPLLALWSAVQFASGVVRRFDFEGSMLPQVERVFRGFGAKQLPYFAISKTPPPPSSVTAYLNAAIEFRLMRLRRRLRW